MNRMPSLKLIRFVLLFLSLPFIFTADARMFTNHPPVANDDNYTRHGSGNLGHLLANDYDPDAGDTISLNILTYPTHGNLYGTAYPDVKSYQLNSTSYVGTDSFTYQACDNWGACSNTATVTINVVNNAPQAVDDSYYVHGSTTIGPFASNDSDPDGDSLSIPTIVTYPSHGTLNGTADPSLKKYTPASSYVGQDSFTYSICDSLNLCSTATVNLNVQDYAPVAVSDMYVVRGNTNVGPFMANDYDPDGDTLSIYGDMVSYPTHGTLYGLAYPTYPYDMKSYVPQTGYAGADFFSYKIYDSLNVYSTPATVTLFVLKNDGAENAGAASCNIEIAKPINVSNGNMYLQQTDYQLRGAGEAINVARTYNSILQNVGLFGRGWSTAYDESVESYDNYLVRVNMADGRAVYFGRPTGTGAFTPPEKDFHGQVVKNADGSFTLTFQDGRVHSFSSTGKLLTLTDRNGNQTTLTYGANSKLASVTDAFGRVLTLTTDANARVLSMADSTGTIATYTYGSSQELLSVTYPDSSKY